MSRSRGDAQLLRRLLLQARRYWSNLTAIFCLDLLAMPLNLLLPVPMMLAVDSVIGSQPLPAVLSSWLPDAFASTTAGRLLVLSLLVIAIAVLTQAQKLGNWLLQTYTGEKLCVDFRALLLRQSQRLSLLYHDMAGSSDAIYRIQYDAAAIQWVIVYGISPFVTAFLTLAGMVVVTALIDWQLALVALAVTPVLFGLTQFFRKRLRHVWSGVKEIESSSLGIVQEILASLRVVQAFGQEEREQERFVNQSSRSVRAHVRVVMTESAFSLAIAMTIALGTALVLYVGVRHVQSGLLTLGQFLLVMAYLVQLYHPLETIGRQIATLQGGLASADRAFKLLDQVVDVADEPAAHGIDRARGVVRFEDVSFGYDPARPVLSEVTFDVPAATRVGIVGRTGAGKTTLINLLLRFYDPSHGSVLLDGIDLRGYKVADLREQFSVVLQEPVLFSRSIGENIAYGRPDATMDEIINAAKAAHADAFIAKLPQGYDTPVGERGARLSGGERQRISLARAFLKDAPVLVLDEPTSSVDVKTEASIIEAMERLMRGRTTFIIAHRLATLESCDLLLHVEDGRVRRIERATLEQRDDERARLAAALEDSAREPMTVVGIS